MYENDPQMQKIIDFSLNAQDKYLDTLLGYFKRAIEEYKKTQLQKFKRNDVKLDPWVIFVIEE